MLPKQIAAQIRNFHWGSNSTGVNLREKLADVDWQMAKAQVSELNSIAALLFHLNYYIDAVSGVLEGKALEARDKYSFDLPPIRSQKDWEQLCEKVWTDAERMAQLVEAMAPALLDQTFVKEDYGTYYKNITGVIEHGYYHLGQISLIKKLLDKDNHHD